MHSSTFSSQLDPERKRVEKDVKLSLYQRTPSHLLSLICILIMEINMLLEGQSSFADFFVEN